MRPILYKSDEKVFDSYGLGEIDATKATVTRERNGNYTLYLEYPAGQVMASQFKPDMRIKADAGVRTKNQTFIISRIVKDSSSLVKVYAKHISHLTEHMGLVDGVTVDGTARDALYLWSKAVLGGQKFDVWSDIDTIGKTSWTVDKVKTARDALGGVEGSILDIWGGEYQFDNTTIRLHKQLGRKAPTVLEYGRNILSAEDDEDIESAYTSIYPYATYTPQSESGGANDPVTVTLPEKVVDSDWLGLYADRRVLAVDLSSKFGEKDIPTADKLRNHAKAYVKANRIGLPKTNTKVEYVDLAKTLDYADMAVMEEVELCDIVPIYYPSIGLTNDEGKVVVVNYDVLNDRNESIEIGMIGQSMRSAMASTVADRLDVLESKQAVLDSSIPAYLLSADGNKVWYSKPDNSKEHKVGDTWFEKNGEYNRIYIWNGEMWEKVMDSEVGIALLNDGIEQAKAKAEEEAQKLRDEISEQFASFDNEAIQQANQKAEEALQKIGANTILANEAKTISSQVLADLDKVRQDAGQLSETVSKDIADFKSQVGSQLGGLATKVEVEQAEGKLVERLSQMNLGRRNLLKQTRALSLNQRPFTTSDKYDGFTIARSVASNGNYADTVFLQTTEPPKGTEYVLVFYARASKDNYPIRTHFYNPNTTLTSETSTDFKSERTADGLAKLTIGREWKRYWVKYTQTAADTVKSVIIGRHGATIDGGDATTTVEICAPALFEGNMVGDWVAADEDNEAIVEAAKAEFTRTAEGLSAKMTAVESYVSKDGELSEALRRYSREETARQITAERSAVARDYVAKTSFTETVDGINRRFETVLAPVDGKIASKIAEYGKGVDGRFATIASQLKDKVSTTDFQKVQETAQLYERIIGSTEKDVTDKVARMVMSNQVFQTEVGKIGGRNYLRNSRFEKSSDFWQEYSSDSNSRSKITWNYTHSQSNLKKVGIHMFSPGNDADFCGVQQRFAFAGKNGDNLTVSLLASSDNPNSGLKVALHYVKNGKIVGQDWRTIEKTKLVAKEYRNFNFTFTIPADIDNLNLMLFAESRRLFNLYVTDVKLETGTIATDWSPAPEDVEQKVEAVSTRVTQLNNSWAVQNLTSAGQVVSQINLLGRNAGIKADTIRLDGQTLANRIDAYEGRFNRLFVADGTFSKLNAGVITANSIDADKIRVNSQLAQKLVADKAFVSSFFADKAVIGQIQAIDIDASRVTSGVLNAKNGAMNIDLNNANVNINNNTAAIRREERDFATQFLKMETGAPLVHGDGGAKASLLTIGANHLREDSGVGFTGLKIWNGKAQRRTTADLIEVVGERIQMRSHKNGGIIVDLQSKETVFYSDSSALILGHPNRRLSDVITNNVDIAGVGSVKAMLGKLQSCFVALRQAGWDTKAQHFKNHINGLF